MTDLAAAGAVTLAGAPFADDLGPAKVLCVHDATLGLDAALVVDNVARGPSIGGLRMAPDVSVEEKIRGNTTAVLDVVRGRRISPREAALGVAVTQVRRAMTYRRFSTL